MRFDFARVLEDVLMRFIDTRLILGLSLWVFGFALMTAGWLVDELFESWGEIPAKILRKLGAVIVAAPIIALLWRISKYLYVNRVDIVLLINDGIKFLHEVFSVVKTL